MVNYDKVPTETMKHDVKNYVENGQMYGDFLYSLFSNDLMGAFSHSDLENREKLNEWTFFIYNEVPAQCWGSPEKVEKWEGLNQ